MLKRNRDLLVFVLQFFAAMVAILVVSLGTLLLFANNIGKRALFGRYHLVNPSGCRDDVEDSHLEIRENGTFDQDVLRKGGLTETVENGHWSYDKTTQRTTFSKFLVSTELSFPTVNDRRQS
jgi:hypothetical protein